MDGKCNSPKVYQLPIREIIKTPHREIIAVRGEKQVNIQQSFTTFSATI